MIFSSSQDDVQLHINDTNLNLSVNLIKIPNKSQFLSIKSVCNVFCSNAFLLFFQKAFFKVFLTHYNSFVPELSNGSGAGLSVVDQKGLSWVSGLRIFRFY